MYDLLALKKLFVCDSAAVSLHRILFCYVIADALECVFCRSTPTVSPHSFVQIRWQGIKYQILLSNIIQKFFISIFYTSIVKLTFFFKKDQQYSYIILYEYCCRQVQVILCNFQCILIN